MTSNNVGHSHHIYLFLFFLINIKERKNPGIVEEKVSCTETRKLIIDIFRFFFYYDLLTYLHIFEGYLPPNES